MKRRTLTLLAITLIVLTIFLNTLDHPKSKRYIIEVVASKNFKGYEYFTTKKIFENSGYKVVTLSKGNTALSVEGTKIKTKPINSSFNLIKNASAFVLVGGSGVLEYKNYTPLITMIKIANSENKTIGAICLAPVILSYSGVLKEKNATVWGNSSFQEYLAIGGANYKTMPVVEDKNIVTAKGPKYAKEFAYKLLALINSKNKVK